MRVRCLPCICALALLECWVFPIHSARAQAEMPESVRALEIGHEGLKLFQIGDYRSALLRFEEAEQLAHSPVFVLYVARCQRGLGRLTNAKATLEQLVSQGTGPKWPAVWRKAVRDAEE